jgi:hypothetical protein
LRIDDKDGEKAPIRLKADARRDYVGRISDRINGYRMFMRQPVPSRHRQLLEAPARESVISATVRSPVVSFPTTGRNDNSKWKP